MGKKGSSKKGSANLGAAPQTPEPQPPTPQNDPSVPASARKKAFAELIERYKIQNPVKYAQKAESLQKQLDAIK